MLPELSGPGTEPSLNDVLIRNGPTIRLATATAAANATRRPGIASGFSREEKADYIDGGGGGSLCSVPDDDGRARMAERESSPVSMTIGHTN